MVHSEFNLHCRPINHLMKKELLYASACILLSVGCNTSSDKKSPATAMTSIHEFFESYYNEHNRLFPMTATANGDNRFNDLFPNDISEEYRDTLRKFYALYQDSLTKIDFNSLDANDQTSYEILKW